jgi:hypothetical protein
MTGGEAHTKDIETPQYGGSSKRADILKILKLRTLMTFIDEYY